MNPSHPAAQTRVESITRVTSPHSRFETTIIERQGSRVVLQGVKTMKPDSDDEGEDDTGGSSSAEPSAPHSGHAQPVAHAGSRPCTPSQAAAGSPGSSALRFVNVAAQGAGGPAPPGALPAVAPLSPRAPAAPALGGGGGGGGGGPAGAMPASFRRAPNRVASLPMLLDGGMPCAPRPLVEAEGLPEPEHAGPQVGVGTCVAEHKENQYALESVCTACVSVCVC